MPSTTIPGGAVCHKIITDECRKNRGDGNAQDVVLTAIEGALLSNMDRCTVGEGWEFHCVLTVVRPQPIKLKEGGTVGV